MDTQIEIIEVEIKRIGNAFGKFDIHFYNNALKLKIDDQRYNLKCVFKSIYEIEI